MLRKRCISAQQVRAVDRKRFCFYYENKLHFKIPIHYCSVLFGAGDVTSKKVYRYNRTSPTNSSPVPRGPGGKERPNRRLGILPRIRSKMKVGNYKKKIAACQISSPPQGGGKGIGMYTNFSHNSRNQSRSATRWT